MRKRKYGKNRYRNMSEETNQDGRNTKKLSWFKKIKKEILV